MEGHLIPLLVMFAGIVTHILKKAMTLNMKAKSAGEKFNLKDYLMGHPYQTTLTFIAGGGAYLALMDSTTGLVSLSAAFFAGVAANSLGDIAPGSR